MDKVTELQERIAQLKKQLSHEAEVIADSQYADGQAYYDCRRQFVRIREELFAAERELTALTVHTCHMPEHVATQRLRAKMEEARKLRLAEAMRQLELRFGGEE